MKYRALVMAFGALFILPSSGFAQEEGRFQPVIELIDEAQDIAKKGFEKVAHSLCVNVLPNIEETLKTVVNKPNYLRDKREAQDERDLVMQLSIYIDGFCGYLTDSELLSKARELELRNKLRSASLIPSGDLQRFLDELYTFKYVLLGLE